MHLWTFLKMIFQYFPGETEENHKKILSQYMVTGGHVMAQVFVAGLSPWRPGFVPRSIHVGFVVDKVALGQVFLRVLRFSCQYIIPPSLSKLISSGECDMLT
jgi:acyl-CoA thioesterase